jgi:hypothetical protein
MQNLLRSKWVATIYYDNKKHSLGSSHTKREAVLAYDTAARQRAADTGNYVQLNYDGDVDGKLDDSYLTYLTAAESKAKEAKKQPKIQQRKVTTRTHEGPSVISKLTTRKLTSRQGKLKTRGA